jgi:hypothetical protein
MIRYPVVGLMYTRTCPMACGHCITESSPRAKGHMRPEQVLRWLPAIRRFTNHLSFTGGEPLLFHRDIVAIVPAAREIGLDVSVVTAGGWVKNEAMARERIRELVAAGIVHLAISWDPYHEEFASPEIAMMLAEEASAAGITVDVRATLPAHRQAEEYQAPFRHLPVRLDSSSLAKLGTAQSLPDEHFHWSDTPPKGVCPTVLRPVIEPDGAVYACCGPGHFSRRPSPLVLGNAEEEPLEDILARGAADPILEAISLIGPHGLYRLLQSHPGGSSSVAPRRRYSGVCELCLDINGSPDAVEALRERLEDQDAQILLAAARMWAERKQRDSAAVGVG